MELKDIATRFENVDAEKVSLGSAVSALGAGVMMKTSRYYAGSDDKGYRMAQVNVYGKLMWMPVNENGVTDQAALQAYKKDQGHLDINRMQATDAEAPGKIFMRCRSKLLKIEFIPSQASLYPISMLR